MKVGIIKRIAAMVAVPILCLSARSYQNRYNTNSYKTSLERAKEVKALQVNYAKVSGTPADSVVFYGGFYDGDNDYIFTQIDSSFEPDSQGLFNERYFVSAPVKPGSCYMLEYWYWIGNNFYSMNDFMPHNSPLIIKVPEEPGLYYFGSYAGYNSLSWGRLIDWTSKPSDEMKPKALEKALAYYKGTAWEPLIKKELADAEISASQHKSDRKTSEKEEKAKKRENSKKKKEGRK